MLFGVLNDVGYSRAPVVVSEVDETRFRVLRGRDCGRTEPREGQWPLRLCGCEQPDETRFLGSQLLLSQAPFPVCCGARLVVYLPAVQ